MDGTRPLPRRRRGGERRLVPRSIDGPGDLASRGVPTTAQPRRTGSRWRAKLIDTWCSITGIMFAYGTAHHQCPSGVCRRGYSREHQGQGRQHLSRPQIGDDDVSVSNPKIVRIQSHQVTVDGDLIERDGVVKYLLVDAVAGRQGDRQPDRRRLWRRALRRVSHGPAKPVRRRRPRHGRAAVPAGRRRTSGGSRGGEKAVVLKGRVVDLYCEVGGPARPIAAAASVNSGSSTGRSALSAAKGNTLFAGAVADLAPYCGREVEIDGLVIESPRMPSSFVQKLKAPGDAEFRPADAFGKAWETRTARPRSGSGPIHREGRDRRGRRVRHQGAGTEPMRTAAIALMAGRAHGRGPGALPRGRRRGAGRDGGPARGPFRRPVRLVDQTAVPSPTAISAAGHADHVRLHALRRHLPDRSRGAGAGDRRARCRCGQGRFRVRDRRPRPRHARRPRRMAGALPARKRRPHRQRSAGSRRGGGLSRPSPEGRARQSGSGASARRRGRLHRRSRGRSRS